MSYSLVYAGRDDDPTLETSLFDDLQMPRPDVFLGVGSSSLNEITSQVMARFDAYLDEHPVDVVIVVDDLASTMAAAIVAKKRGLTLAHLVAGTRSFDIKMPKEVNRLVIDALSDILFTAGIRSNSVATREQAEGSSTYMVGNILMDTLRFCQPRLRKPILRPSTLDLRPQTSDLRPQASDLRPQTSDLRLQTSDLRLQTSDLRPQTSDLRLQTSDHRLQTSDHRLQTSDHRPQTSDLRPQTSDLRPQTLDSGGYLVLTINRRALLADTEKLSQLLHAIVTSVGDTPIIAPLRDDAKCAVEKAIFHLESSKDNRPKPEVYSLRSEVYSPKPEVYSLKSEVYSLKSEVHSLRSVLNVQPPMSYLEFGWLTSHAKGIITDSGNVAEEATFNGVPCITLNSYTEHQETVTLGTNVLTGEAPEQLAQAVRQMVCGEWKSGSLPDRWDGRTAERIVKILME